MNSVEVTQQKGSTSVVLEWQSNSVNDMLADAVLATILQIESNPATAKMCGSKCQHSHNINVDTQGTYIYIYNKNKC